MIQIQSGPVAGSSVPRISRGAGQRLVPVDDARRRRVRREPGGPGGPGGAIRDAAVAALGTVLGLAWIGALMLAAQLPAPRPDRSGSR
jgi:hypothetical protein